MIPSHLLKQCGFTKEVSLEIKNDTLVISKAKKPREGWTEAFIKPRNSSWARKSCANYLCA